MKRQIPSHADVTARGKAFFQSIAGEKPSLFNKGAWTGKVMDWAMRHEDFKVQLFRFVDVLPYLNSSESLARHIKEYFGQKGAGDGSDIPAVLRWGAGKSGVLGGLAGKVMGQAIRKNIEAMARQFIIGQNTSEAVAALQKLRKDGFAFAVDYLGESTVSEAEADAYLAGYLELLEALGARQEAWKALGGHQGLDWGQAPKINVSVKPTAFYSQCKSVDVEGTVAGLYPRISAIYRKVVELGGALCVDMEQLAHKEAAIALFKRLRADPEFVRHPHLSIVMQAYLRCNDEDLEELLAWGRETNLPFGIRLVKGAYWDYETLVAKQNGWEVPVWTVKAESDAAFERQTKRILEHADLVYYQCASHNIRSISHAMETARALGVPEDRYEFQVLYGMAEPVRKGLQKVAGRVRLYCPYGELVPGMAYLVRRLLENTANEGFVKQGFEEGVSHEDLLQDPVDLIRHDCPAGVPGAPGGLGPFVNEPMVDFTVAANRRAYEQALQDVRKDLGRTCPLHIDGKDLETADTLDSYNPADTDEVVGRVCQAGTAEVDRALAAARRAYLDWRDVPAAERAGVLVKAAAYARDNIFALSALQTLEVGKQWDQAYADVAEAVDFLEYYAREMLRLARPRRMGSAPGELNHLFYQGKGVAAVIAPWNFPFAISVGMVAAAVVTGNSVVYKPSGLSSVVGRGLVDMFRAAGLPDGVFNYTPGRGAVMGDHLIDAPEVAVVAFTGSVEVGLRIQERAAVVRPGQHHVKRVIAEMGGKNAIIIDDDADLDEAVKGVLYSAFAFQGQKCSACSRVIVLDAIYDRFIERLVEGAKALKLGPAEAPGFSMGPVVDRAAQKNVTAYADLAAEEGSLLLRRDWPHGDADNVCYAPLTIVEGVTPAHRIAQEEVFGPVLVVMRVKDFDQALEWANATRFALTGGVFSRSPQNLERARREFRVGNLYLNRGCTGALVERHAFGGFKLSGVGSKTGGPDYLVQFMDPRLVSENTMRRGFAPVQEDDDWVC